MAVGGEAASYDRPMVSTGGEHEQTGSTDGVGRGRSKAELSGRWMRRIAVAGVVTATIVVAGGCAHEAAVPTAGPTIYASLGSVDANPSNKVAVVDAATGTTARPITVGTLPAGSALINGGRNLLVAVKAENALVDVDTGTGKTVRRLDVGLEPVAVAVTPGGSSALVADFGSSSVTVVRLSNFSVAASIPVGRQPVSVAITGDGTLALVACYQDGTLVPIALPSYVPGPPVMVGPEPISVLIEANGRQALVAGFQTSSVTPVSLPGLVVQPTVPVGVNPTDMAQVGPHGSVWISGGNSVVPFDPNTRTIGPAIAVGGPAECVAVQSGSFLWIGRQDGRVVQVDTVHRSIRRVVPLGGIPSYVTFGGPTR